MRTGVVRLPHLALRRGPCRGGREEQRHPGVGERNRGTGGCSTAAPASGRSSRCSVSPRQRGSNRPIRGFTPRCCSPGAGQTRGRNGISIRRAALGHAGRPGRSTPQRMPLSLSNAALHPEGSFLGSTWKNTRAQEFLRTKIWKCKTRQKRGKKPNLHKKQILNYTTLTFYLLHTKRISFDNGILYEKYFDAYC